VNFEARLIAIFKPGNRRRVVTEIQESEFTKNKIHSPEKTVIFDSCGYLNTQKKHKRQKY
jgi:hypothetical protein